MLKTQTIRHRQMTTLISNEHRARVASSVLHAYAQAKGVQELSGADTFREVIIDLLTDLRHLSSSYDFDFEAAIRLSEFHFEEELGGEGA
jgi:hypothetical protein